VSIRYILFTRIKENTVTHFPSVKTAAGRELPNMQREFRLQFALGCSGHISELVAIIQSWWQYFRAGGHNSELVAIIQSWWQYFRAGGHNSELVAISCSCGETLLRRVIGQKTFLYLVRCTYITHERCGSCMAAITTKETTDFLLRYSSMLCILSGFAHHIWSSPCNPPPQTGPISFSPSSKPPIPHLNARYLMLYPNH